MNNEHFNLMYDERPKALASAVIWPLFEAADIEPTWSFEQVGGDTFPFAHRWIVLQGSLLL
ncbi:MAG: hypothetical protein N3G20_08010 [Verrucomicrobiae bacterium]|nr:hypothetical protein [Verrucomicrobiae bacterium]